MARAFKILSDFDGVWTNQVAEAEEILRFTADSLVELSTRPEAETRRLIADLLDRLHSEPHGHGWAPDGRITAYVDEDPLCLPSAMCRLIDAEFDELRAAVLTDWGSMVEFSEHCFVTATRSYVESGRACMIPDAADAYRALRATGAEVVIISNSGSDKINAWFAGVGVDPSELRIRGSAAKWQLGDSDDAIVVNERSVFIDRPRYRAAIEAEAPDLIIGDVLSLDLALPHRMRTDRAGAAPATLVMRRHAHTPGWASESPVVDSVVQSVAELPDLLRELG